MDEKQLDSKKISEEIEVLRKESASRGLVFSSLEPEQLLEKLRSSSDPFIWGISYASRSVPSDTFFVQIDVKNPDSRIHDAVYAHFFFGPANMIPDSATALLAIDERLYRGYMLFPPISPNATSRVVFNYNFPSGIPVGSYIGNVFIFERIVPVSPIYERYSIGVEII